jgi:hypothetical protein
MKGVSQLGDASAERIAGAALVADRQSVGASVFGLGSVDDGGVTPHDITLRESDVDLCIL